MAPRLEPSGANAQYDEGDSLTSGQVTLVPKLGIPVSNFCEIYEFYENWMHLIPFNVR
jgi:hypothetical protein